MSLAFSAFGDPSEDWNYVGPLNQPPTPEERASALLELRRLDEQMNEAMAMFGRAATAALFGGESAWHAVIHRERYAVETDPGPLDAGLLMSWDRGYAEAYDDDDWEGQA